MRIESCTALVVLVLVAIEPAIGQEQISELTFDTIASGHKIVGSSIDLQGDTVVTGGLSVTGLVELTTEGLRFPDGTVQTTASTGQSSSELCTNRIIEMTPPAAFTEVCFKGGSVQTDSHAISESTLGGNCIPGDVGWIIEQDERAAATWEIARAECLMNGMRLPEFFEWKYSCVNADTFDLNGMTDSWEWATNSPFNVDSNRRGQGATLAGNNGCNFATWGWLSTSDGTMGTYNYRCIR